VYRTLRSGPVVRLLLPIREFPGSNLGPETGFSGWCTHEYHQLPFVHEMFFIHARQSFRTEIYLEAWRRHLLRGVNPNTYLEQNSSRVLQAHHLVLLNK
jgi:hypothetical protein